MDEYLAIIKMFAGNFNPRGFMFCQGQVLSIATNTALFSLLGTTYGGNGQTTFGLPDLRGRIPKGTGTGGGLAPVNLGDVSGVENVTLLLTQMPAHVHSTQLSGAPGVVVSSANATDSTPVAGMAIAAPGTGTGRSFVAANGFINATPDTTLAAGSATAGNLAVSVGPAGSNQPFSIIQPYLGMNYIICIEGLFPSRN